MTTTRQHLNEAALSVVEVLGMIRGMTDAKIDEIMSFDEVGHLAESARNLCECLADQQSLKVSNDD